MKILEKRRHHHDISYRLFFERIGCQGSGYSFDCDENGNIDTVGLELKNPCAYQSYLSCKDNREKYKAPYVEEIEHNYSEPAVGECDHCKAEVYLSGFTNTCDCGADYNMSGQLLAPREQWGIETNESLTDILNIA